MPEGKQACKICYGWEEARSRRQVASCGGEKQDYSAGYPVSFGYFISYLCGQLLYLSKYPYGG